MARSVTVVVPVIAAAWIVSCTLQNAIRVGIGCGADPESGRRSRNDIASCRSLPASCWRAARAGRQCALEPRHDAAAQGFVVRQHVEHRVERSAYLRAVTPRRCVCERREHHRATEVLRRASAVASTSCRAGRTRTFESVRSLAATLTAAAISSARSSNSSTKLTLRNPIDGMLSSASTTPARRLWTLACAVRLPLPDPTAQS